ncbi:MAG TPA: dihydroorotate dehydrogenase-like protein [Saprospiraceae bacterium]|nr:dihydroorotate dehydrogenase-like protein [Saprospiraceae bacterium]HHH54641.1 dihydroorotate dehydrogenase-like protein [Bacteroidota bacterium]
MNLSVDYLGLKLNSPLVVGSSSLSMKIENLKKMENAGAGAVVLRSLFEEEITLEYEHLLKTASESDPHMDYYDVKIKNDNLEKYLQYIKEAKSQINIPIIASVNCTSSHEWTYFGKKIEEAGADAIELNMFIMPSDFEKNCEEIENIYFEIIDKVKQETNLPIAVKLSYYFADLAAFVKKVSQKVEGVILFNRFFHTDFDIENFKIIPSNVLSRSSDVAISLRWISIMAGRVNGTLIASTGVHDGSSVIKEILAGADATQVVSALYKHGIEYLEDMKMDLTSWMERHNYNSIEEFRGKMSQANSPNPASVERMQFMKYFESKKYDFE